MTTTIYIDADACPVKDEAVRVAERHGLVIHFVSNAFMRLPEGPLIKRVVVSDGRMLRTTGSRKGALALCTTGFKVDTLQRH